MIVARMAEMPDVVHRYSPGGGAAVLPVIWDL